MVVRLAHRGRAQARGALGRWAPAAGGGVPVPSSWRSRMALDAHRRHLDLRPHTGQSPPRGSRMSWGCQHGHGGDADAAADSPIPRGRARSSPADERHDPMAMPGVAAACRRWCCGTCAAGREIVVFGDYDVDGVCSTAMLVRALSDLGASPGVASCPSRDEGYGLSADAVERLADERAPSCSSRSTAGSPPSRRSRWRGSSGWTCS